MLQEDTKGVIRIHQWKNVRKQKDQKKAQEVKQRSTKHYTDNPTENQG
jgi:hypothetical protein